MKRDRQVRLRLPDLLAEQLLAVPAEGRADVVARGLAATTPLSPAEIDAELIGWDNSALEDIASVLAAVADGRLAWRGESEDKPDCLFRREYAQGWAMLLRQALAKGKAAS
jgi:hypothetical protein